MIAAFVDTSVLLHAVGGEHPMRDAARTLLTRIADDLVVHIGAETVQEFVFHRMRIGQRESAIAMGRDLVDSVTIHPFDEAIARRAIELMADSPIGGRDAVLAATALEAGFDAIVTDDARFVSAGGLRVVSTDEFLKPHPSE
ncbi:type II toxin-antitoxin system VapC family toxin [Propionimicrobium sp. PCR01-08-3]|uniref:type II toxin-antitoxin system VapC family toxin n=1 Tax=Propionimicrobium sp. PCR01-08-3 TaxID=3052086 RepID=UPI00255C88C2|nr:type II toxin-antitoxin system VapC family toxin [Propionimicrobium sp. PCR01-08-3]WIY81998.1 type II toxin-antitoxin system VapC family toxin [Propionimicrobium sp. PCR01-08-3]